MKYVDDYRDPAAAARLARLIAGSVTRPWTIMEVCGGQTHSIVRSGILSLLPPEISLVHGPGCPVCVTPAGFIDEAAALAARPRTIVASYGDMLRVPGTSTDLLGMKAEGADVRVVYSPLDAVALARRNPEREVVFFAVGFETTAPANGMAVMEARRLGLRNFSILCAHVLVVPAMRAILSLQPRRVEAFLAAGHVCTITGYEEYEPLAAEFGVPIVVTGFEPVDILQGIAMATRLLEEGRCVVENQYRRVVHREGNRAARAMLSTLFEVCDRRWRGLGLLPASGLRLRGEWSAFDAERRFELRGDAPEPETGCRAADVLRGILRPDACPLFGTACTPERPMGAPMVSSEGACAAYHRYRPAHTTFTTALPQ